MILLKDGTEITEDFGRNGITDIRKVINNYGYELKYLEDEYILKTYINGCIVSNDLQFVHDFEILVCYLNIIDSEAKNLNERMLNEEINRPRELKRDIKDLTKAKEILLKYSDAENKRVLEAVKVINGSISELQSIESELKSYIFKHPEVEANPIVLSSHLKYYGNKLLPKRIDFFKPKPQIIEEMINNCLHRVKKQLKYVDIPKLETLFDYLKTYYKKP